MLGGMLGAGGGVIFGVALGILIGPTPEPDPRQRLAHEWYAMAVLQYAFGSAVGGLVLGSILGAYAQREVFWLAITGLFLGLIVGCLAWHYDILETGVNPRPSRRSYNGLIIVVPTLALANLGALVGIIYCEARADLRRQAEQG
jgi:MFS family permease